MVKIRLKRMGATKRPFYRLVVADARSPRDGRFIEAIGYYDPLPTPAKVEIDADKVREWIRKGARPSDSARDLLQSQGILPPRPRPAGQVDTPKAGAGAPAAAPKQAAKDEPAPVETAPVETAVAEPDGAEA
ncbi:MAG: hypothetical protein NVSMB29_19050 [Candidatus Dormibacteria bacterium]